jgi:broad specificity phosphatase PhoE
MNVSTYLWLVRHGQTDWNLEGRFLGQADQPLNKNGVAQAEEVAHFFSQKKIKVIFCSDLKRAVQTASIIAQVAGLQVIVDPRLREICQGVLEGKIFSTIQEIYPDIVALRRNDPLNVRAPGGETIPEVSRRVYQAADDISLKYPGQHILVVSHGVALATLIVKARGIPLDKTFEYIPENASPLKIKWTPIDISNNGLHPD